MLRAHAVEDVRRAERAAMAALADGALMQRAAAGLAAAVLDLLGGAYGRRVLLLVGPGDNGGDALWAGARLAARGAQVEALLLAERAHEAGLRALRAAGGRATRDLDDLAPAADVVVDGIVGIGGRPGLDPGAVAALERFAGVPVVAVDVPSGVDVDTGTVDGPHVRADLTVTFGTHKVAHLVDPASARLRGAAPGRPRPRRRRPRRRRPSRRSSPTTYVRLLPRPGDVRPQVHPRRRRRPRRARAPIPAPRCSRWPAPTPAWSAWSATSARRRSRTPCAAPTPRSSAPVGCRHGWSARAAATTPRRCSPRPAPTTYPMVVDADALRHVDGPLPGCVLTPHAGELAAMLGVERAEVEAAPLALRPRRGRPLGLRGAAQGPPHPRRRPRRPGARDHHRRPVAGHRRRRRRARRPGRVAARRRPRALRRRVRRLVAARRRRDARRPAADR